MPGTRKLGRPTAHRNAMLRGQVTYLFKYGKVETTVTRAKEVRAVAEKMITLGKQNTIAARRAANAYITEPEVVAKLFTVIAPKYEEICGGYTTIYKLGPRRGDAAEMALITLTQTPADIEAAEKGKKSKKK
ncbi:MAG: 50S ribosomal protein L17 [Clostridia bacterium]|nr:50S ribosomal protein L17 [Clostridia bacterium]